MEKNFPSDRNFKGDTYWCWKAAKISYLTLLLMRSLKNMLGKPSLFVCFRYVLSRDAAASSNCNHHSLRLENWYHVALFPYCSRVFPCKGIRLLQIQRQMLLETFSSFCVNESSGGYPSQNNMNICRSAGLANTSNTVLRENWVKQDVLLF